MLHSRNVADENYLRGVQGRRRRRQVTFTSIFPAGYDGRWPHIHVEVYDASAGYRATLPVPV